MKMKVYAIWDSAVKAYMVPFFMQTDGQAVRGFQANANDKESMINKFPDQYTLFRIGEYDDQTGRMEPENPTTLGTALQYKEDSFSASEKADLETILSIVTELQGKIK